MPLTATDLKICAWRMRRPRPARSRVVARSVALSPRGGDGSSHAVTSTCLSLLDPYRALSLCARRRGRTQPQINCLARLRPAGEH
jgi:hypothetical protein